MNQPEFSFAEREASRLGYRVTESGSLLNPEGREIKGNTSRMSPYPRFRFAKNGKCVAVHRLAAFQKFGDAIYQPGIVVRHIDGNKGNPSPSNLELGTESENRMDIDAPIRRRSSTIASKVAQKHRHSEIVQAWRSGMTYDQIRAAFGISSKGTVSFIVRKSLSSTPETIAAAFNGVQLKP